MARSLNVRVIKKAADLFGSAPVLLTIHKRTVPRRFPTNFLIALRYWMPRNVNTIEGKPPEGGNANGLPRRCAHDCLVSETKNVAAWFHLGAAVRRAPNVSYVMEAAVWALPLEACTTRARVTGHA